MEAAGNTISTPGDGSRILARTVEQAGTGAHDAIDKVSDAAGPAVDRVAAGAHRAVDRLVSTAGRAANTLGLKGEQLRNAQVRAMEQCRGYVRDHPATSLGIALAAGFLLSRFLTWRSS